MTIEAPDGKAAQAVYAVVLKVTRHTAGLSRRDRVVELSRLARRAVAESSRKAGIFNYVPLKDEKGVPIPSDGLFWSLSHKPDYVAGVVAPYAVGIDLEKIRPVNPGLYARVAHEDEWDLVGRSALISFFRYFTAKEAVLKAIGIGLRGLRSCRVITIEDDSHMTIQYQDRHWSIGQIYFDNHVAAVVEEGHKTCWDIQDGSI